MTWWQYFVIYVFVAGVISFAVMYRFGPVENPRTFNLIQWSIQLVALILIALASQLPQLGFTFVMIVLTFYFLPARYVLPASLFITSSLKIRTVEPYGDHFSQYTMHGPSCINEPTPKTQTPY